MPSYPGTIFAKIKNVRFAQLYKYENWKLLKVFYSWEWSLNGQYLPRVLESHFRPELQSYIRLFKLEGDVILMNLIV